ncbi:alpha-tectorin-like [Protopterus annectens]|uniref:alpha-tectorin-like n=1 Tax=Protopterus annectens TaxID=7888 RepID=UPI001CFA0334|nr:alpha-tectorin-like [Protopterus annectens]
MRADYAKSQIAVGPRDSCGTVGDRVGKGEISEDKEKDVVRYHIKSFCLHIETNYFTVCDLSMNLSSALVMIARCIFTKCEFQGMRGLLFLMLKLHFYPYGPQQGDIENPKNDDGGSPEIPISVAFPFFEKFYTSLYVNNNGVVSFQAPVSQYTPNAFPLSDGRAFVAPFWADVDNSLYGSVYYRESVNAELLHRTTAEVNRYFPELQFTTTWVFVATWDQVAFFGSLSSKANTFQAALITDGILSFIILNYGDIKWTTGTASGGNSTAGLGGVPAQAGFNSGNAAHYFSIPGSRTNDVLHIGSTSNIKYPGRWVFRADVFSVAGGCLYNGSFFRPDDIFWIDSACQRKCVCLENNTVSCEDVGCATYQVCQPSSWYHICLTVGIKTCTVSGDPHYYTFDGKLFHFQGTCTYILSQMCGNNHNLTNYRVEAKNENRGNVLVSWTQLIRVIVYGNEIVMARDSTEQVMVNNVMSLLPLSLVDGKIKVFKSGFSITVSTNFGLVVSYDGYHFTTISIPMSYYNSTCGLCGTLTDDPFDDFLTSEGVLSLTDLEFVNSWMVQDNDIHCGDEHDEDYSFACSAEDYARFSGNAYCGIIISPEGPFNMCKHQLPSQSFLDSCIYDLCADGGYLPTLCQALSSYAARCEAEGMPPKTWRKKGFCEINCPENSHYESCGTACPASCVDSTAPLFCNKPCRESCICNDGYILSGGKCVALSQCGCQFQGHYYSVGTEVILTETCSKKCICRNATSEMKCQDYGCTNAYEECRIVNGIRGCYPTQYGTCWVSGDPHYYTFDGLPFDFQGTCSYILTKYCGKSSSLVDFSVKVENENRGTPLVSWTRLVEVNVYNHHIVISMKYRGKVQVDGLIVNLPVALECGTILIYHSGSSAVIETDFGLIVSYDWYHLVSVKISGTYSGQLCGLCGNFNWDINDEFITPSGYVTESPLHFGNSWQDQTVGSHYLTCLENSHYEVCTSSCPASCTNLAFPSSCQASCEEGCQCNNGFVLSGEECVTLVQCGCMYNSKYYKADETFWNGNNCEEICKCDSATNTVQCSNSSCAPGEICGIRNGIHGCYRLPHGICWATGDPHYITFDGASYDFQGTCKYVLAELVNTTEASDYFRIEVKNENWADVPVSFTAKVFIFVYDTQIQFERGYPGTVKLHFKLHMKKHVPEKHRL